MEVRGEVEEVGEWVEEAEGWNWRKAGGTATFKGVEAGIDRWLPLLREPKGRVMKMDRRAKLEREERRTPER